MRRYVLRIIFLLMALLTVSVFPGAAQASVSITSFTSSATQVGRTALSGRTARIPVSWATANRPLTANLFFEQVLPDGTTINVELPRVIPFVASVGDGVAAPILPQGEVSSITLRVSLINLFTNFVYDSKEIVIPIVQGNSGGDGSGYVPALTKYDVRYSAPVNRAELDNGTVRLPVSWTAINRPTWTNLVFEQVLPDGTIRNVELPRPFQWVNSSDSGMVAPVSVGAAAEQIVLRVRLVDFAWNRTYDQIYAYVPIQTTQNAPDIIGFSTTTTSISKTIVAGGNARIDVNWTVNNRPQGTNLVFEQMMPDGTVRNAELPRDVLIVPSSGYGVVAPILPSQTVNQLVFRLRLVDLSNNSTLDSQQLTIPLFDPNDSNRVVVTGNGCYTSPFPANQGVTVGGQGRVQRFGDGAQVGIYTTTDGFDSVASIGAGTTFTILEGPYCSYYPSSAATSNRRRWRINAGGKQGWLEEYDWNANNSRTYYFVPANQNDIPSVTVDSFSISPTSIDGSDVDSTNFTFTWATTNAVRIQITPMFFESTNGDGSTTISGSEFDTLDSTQTFTLIAFDSQRNLAEATTTLAVDTTIAINSFTIDKTTTAGNTQVTFSWDISGDFRDAYLSFPVQVNPERIYTVTSNTGTYAYTIPNWVVADAKTIQLLVEDEFGAVISRDVQLTVTCTWQWQMSVGETECPSAFVSRVGAYQQFQRGFMIWLPQNSGNVIYVFYNDGSADARTDSWDGSDYTIDGTPPDGLIVPARGFGYLWNTEPTIRSGLGWATGAEQSYTVNSQARFNIILKGATVTYYSLPDGRIVRLDSTGGLYPTRTWSSLG